MSCMTQGKENEAMITNIIERILISFPSVFFYRSSQFEGGIYVYGLYLEAAHWNGTHIDEQVFHQPREQFPMIHIKV